MILGAFLAWAGWAGLVLGNPIGAGLFDPAVTTLNLFLSAAAAAMVVSVYTWFVTTQPDAMAIARGTVAGLVAVSSAGPFVPSWAAILIGATGGMLFLFGLYVWEQRVRLDDPSGLVATLGAPGIWGLLAVALFADGRWGAGWNGVGDPAAAGQGVTGLLASQTTAAVGVGQFQAQLVGLAALFVAGWLLPWLLFKTVLWLREHLHQLSTRSSAVATAASTSVATTEAAAEEPQSSEEPSPISEQDPVAN